MTAARPGSSTPSDMPSSAKAGVQLGMIGDDRRASSREPSPAWTPAFAGEALKVLVLLLALLGAFPAFAQTRHVAMEAISETAAPAPGSTVVLAFRSVPDKGWHGYWKNPGDAGSRRGSTGRCPPA
ncbi:hypothetical protein AB5I41_11690 [Sphingomonas sp. MMS24-JH45]